MSKNVGTKILLIDSNELLFANRVCPYLKNAFPLLEVDTKEVNNNDDITYSVFDTDESNSTWDTALSINEDTNIKGVIRRKESERWYKVEFNSDGKANFYVNPHNRLLDVNIKIYSLNDDGELSLLVSSKSNTGQFKLLTLTVLKNESYYIVIDSNDHSSNTLSTYHFRCKLYATELTKWDLAVNSYISLNPNLTELQRTALLKIPSKLKTPIYNSQETISDKLTSNPHMPVILFFEGAGNYLKTKAKANEHARGRYGALVVVLRDNRIVYCSANGSTLPDFMNNYKEAIVKEGAYRFVSGTHPRVDGYPALRIEDEVPAYYIKGNRKTATGINIHKGYNSNGVSEGCLTVYSYKKPQSLIENNPGFFEFGEAVGFLKGPYPEMDNVYPEEPGTHDFKYYMDMYDKNEVASYYAKNPLHTYNTADVKKNIYPYLPYIEGIAVVDHSLMDDGLSQLIRGNEEISTMNPNFETSSINKNVQSALSWLGYFIGAEGVDGITNVTNTVCTSEKAIRAFQRQHSIVETGLPEDILETVVASAKDNFDTELAVSVKSILSTTSCEGGFATLAWPLGDSISFGILQWNIKMGTLQTLLNSFKAIHPNIMRDSFIEADGTHGVRIYNLLVDSILNVPVSQGVTFMNESIVRNSSEYKLWVKCFNSLGLRDEMKFHQVKSLLNTYHVNTLAAITSYNNYMIQNNHEEYVLQNNEITYATIYDLVVQNGGLVSKDVSYQTYVNELNKLKSDTELLKFLGQPDQVSTLQYRILLTLTVAIRVSYGLPIYRRNAGARKISRARGFGYSSGKILADPNLLLTAKELIMEILNRVSPNDYYSTWTYHSQGLYDRDYDPTKMNQLYDKPSNIQYLLKLIEAYV